VTTLYTASVPVCVHYLSRLDVLLTAAQLHAHENANANHPNDQTLLDARLTRDMLPFAEQVETACYFTLRTCFPLAGLATPAFAAWPRSLAGLRQRIEHTTELLRTLTAADFVGAESRQMSSRAGHAELLLPAPEFLFRYAMPNFFFHLGMAYAILRAQGVPVGKGEFDGYHVYPPSVPSDEWPLR
jgi:uncharacterized protein